LTREKKYHPFFLLTIFIGIRHIFTTIDYILIFKNFLNSFRYYNILKFKNNSEKNGSEDDLEKLLDIVIKLVSGLDNKSKVALKDLLVEIEIIYTKIIDILLPFYELNNNTVFQNEFRSRYKNYNEIVQKDLKYIDNRFNIIKTKIDYLVENHGWRSDKIEKVMQVFGKKENNSKKEELLKEFEKMVYNCYTNNKKTFYKISDVLLNHLNKELVDVNSTLDRGDITSARMKLQLFFEESEFSLDNIKQLLQFLKNIIDYL
jgi:replicative superfamily II helicase